MSCDAIFGSHSEEVSALIVEKEKEGSAAYASGWKDAESAVALGPLGRPLQQQLAEAIRTPVPEAAEQNGVHRRYMPLSKSSVLLLSSFGPLHVL
eukprot:COSAG02_NODE_19155_length_897_cov_1.177945_2_plen_95_part_00